jgi:hypothetical protein
MLPQSRRTSEAITSHNQKPLKNMWDLIRSCSEDYEQHFLVEFVIIHNSISLPIFRIDVLLASLRSIDIYQNTRQTSYPRRQSSSGRKQCFHIFPKHRKNFENFNSLRQGFQFVARWPHAAHKMVSWNPRVCPHIHPKYVSLFPSISKNKEN